jgi:hypothetical protein
MLWRSLSPVRHTAGFIEPCLPTLGQTVPSGPQWAYEIKHDGYRFICRMEGNRVRVFSRRGNNYTDRVPRIVDTLARLPASSVTLDGEGVACGPHGVTNFELLRAALGRPAEREVFLYAFDLLELRSSPPELLSFIVRLKVAQREPGRLFQCHQRRPIVAGETQVRRQNDRARDATAIDTARLLRSALARHSSLCARISASSARRRAATCFKFSICAS